MVNDSLKLRSSAYSAAECNRSTATSNVCKADNHHVCSLVRIGDRRRRVLRSVAVRSTGARQGLPHSVFLTNDMPFHQPSLSKHRLPPSPISTTTSLSAQPTGNCRNNRQIFRKKIVFFSSCRRVCRYGVVEICSPAGRRTYKTKFRACNCLDQVDVEAATTR